MRVLSHHSGFSVTCECNEEEVKDDDDDERLPARASSCPGSSGRCSPPGICGSAQRGFIMNMYMIYIYI